MNAAHAGATLAFLLAVAPASAQNVKITPVGSHPGELCANDRAIVFEDPTGVRFLYDPAHNVTGGDDPRLGTIHLVLLTHMHGDHVGDQKLKAPGAGTCANSERVRCAEFHDRRSRRGEERSARDDPRHERFRGQQGSGHARRQADRLLPANRWRHHRAGRDGVQLANGSRRRFRREGGQRIARRGNHDRLRLAREQRPACAALGGATRSR